MQIYLYKALLVTSRLIPQAPETVLFYFQFTGTSLHYETCTNAQSHGRTLWLMRMAYHLERLHNEVHWMTYKCSLHVVTEKIVLKHCIQIYLETWRHIAVFLYGFIQKLIPTIFFLIADTSPYYLETIRNIFIIPFREGELNTFTRT